MTDKISYQYIDGTVKSFDTIASAQASRMLIIPDIIVTKGHTLKGVGGANYKLIALEPIHPGKFSITSLIGTTHWYEIVDLTLWIEQFGAIGLNDTAYAISNRTAIHAAIATHAAKGSGGQICIGPGTFPLSDTVNFDTEYKHIRFSGSTANATRFYITSAIPKIVFDIGTVNYESGTLIFEDFSIIEPSNPVAIAAGNVALRIQHRAGVIFNRIYVDKNWTAITYLDSFAPVVDKCLFTNCPGSALFFSSDKSANGAIIRDSRFFNNAKTSLDAAIVIPNGEGISIIGNDIEDNYGGILLNSPQSVLISGGYIERNTSYNVFIGGGTANGIKLDTIWLGEAPLWTVANVDGIEIVNCTFFNTSIDFASTATDYVFERNHHSGTGSIPGSTKEQFSVLSFDIGKLDSNAVQNWFGTTEDAIAVDSNCAYFIEGELILYRTAGTTPHTLKILMGGTAILASGSSFIVEASNDNDGSLGSPRRAYSNLITTGSVVTPANTSATELVMVNLKGIVRVTTTGTLIPQFQYSAAPGGAPLVLAGSKFRIKKIGHKDIKKLGSWS